jgi:uncharacterized alpha/beta hydrolase family protein
LSFLLILLFIIIIIAIATGARAFTAISQMRPIYKNVGQHCHKPTLFFQNKKNGLKE